MSSVMAAPMNSRETRFLKIFLTLTFTYGQYVDVLVRNQNHSFGLAEGFLNSHWTQESKIFWDLSNVWAIKQETTA